VWRKHKDRILTPPPEEGKLSGWDPLKKVVKLFKKEFRAASAEQVRELDNLKKGPHETIRMLKSRLERLSEETGLLNLQEQALKFLKALPQQLRSQVEPALFSESPGGVFSLDRAFEIAERIDLARAFSEGPEGVQEETAAQVAPVTRGASTVV
jgi:hypothetical protein